MSRIYITFLLLLLIPSTTHAELNLVTAGKPTADLVVDVRGAQGDGAAVLSAAGEWLNESLMKASGASLPVVESSGERPALVIGLAKNWPQIAAKAGLNKEAYEGFCIVSEDDGAFILGNSETGVQHGVATLLHKLGFRWYAPSPKWSYTPTLKTVSLDINLADEPALVDRGIWYAYGNPVEGLSDNYRRWAIANRLSVRRLMNTGHSYGNIINRNQEAFAVHPEYYALLSSGDRDNQRSVLARKFCFSNPGLIVGCQKLGID